MIYDIYISVLATIANYKNLCDFLRLKEEQRRNRFTVFLNSYMLKRQRYTVTTIKLWNRKTTFNKLKMYLMLFTKQIVLPLS